jgi:hypothetical protein
MRELSKIRLDIDINACLNILKMWRLPAENLFNANITLPRTIKNEEEEELGWGG